MSNLGTVCSVRVRRVCLSAGSCFLFCLGMGSQRACAAVDSRTRSTILGSSSPAFSGIKTSALSSRGVGVRLTMISFAPALSAWRGIRAAGYTASEEPMTRNRSQAVERRSAVATTSGERLPERDGGRFDDAPASVAGGDFDPVVQTLQYLLHWVARAATEASLWACRSLFRFQFSASVERFGYHIPNSMVLSGRQRGVGERPDFA